MPPTSESTTTTETHTEGTGPLKHVTEPAGSETVTETKTEETHTEPAKEVSTETTTTERK